MELGYLVIDMRRLLDESETGRQAAAALEARFTAARQQYEGLKEQAKGAQGPAQRQLLEEAARFEAQALGEIEAARASLRASLLARAEPALRQIAEARGVRLVLERSAVVLFDDAADVTAEVIAAVDADGPLSA